MRRSHNRMLDAEHGGADRKGRRGCGRKNSGVVGRSVGDDDEEEHEEEDETSQRVEDKGSMPVATGSRSRSRSAAAGPRVPKLPPPVVKDLSNVDLTQELVDLITAQRNFQANAKAIETSTTMTQAIINIRG